jgi:hypothetical protein
VSLGTLSLVDNSLMRDNSVTQAVLAQADYFQMFDIQIQTEKTARD